MVIWTPSIVDDQLLVIVVTRRHSRG